MFAVVQADSVPALRLWKYRQDCKRQSQGFYPGLVNALNQKRGKVYFFAKYKKASSFLKLAGWRDRKGYMEAMKMETPITAPQAGILEQVAHEGQQLHRGQLLACIAKNPEKNS